MDEPLLANDRGHRVSNTSAPVPRTVRDRFWAWAHDAHCCDGSYGLPKNGRITPVEGAHYLGVPNIILVRYGGKPAPPFEQYAFPFKSLKRVHWSMTGAGGATSEEERKCVFQLVATMPNLTGVFMDDFFHLAARSRCRRPVECPSTPAPRSPIGSSCSRSPSGSGSTVCLGAAGVHAPPGRG